ncbi:divalent-cation tolerance protein CutA [Catenovulum adriaticum]|uniref:Divalent-cation tolerance protein CutA n=1 Tax=Catenovulum adriaticum TaxID=2984846 RepID=A0ABY7AJ35_9ALTE|nr:divalent-cation tolerance protein CutA [Catenovulum sp. TS8]WAJ69583.1 divalent-cation tolerance protein CutA [Catenovulum sp. TS8]
MTDFVQVNISCPDVDVANTIATTLVNDKLAACTQLLAPITSTYQWQGQVETNTEYLLLAKTHHSLFSRLEDKVKQIHPYQVPEIIACPIQQVSDDYRTWLANSCLIAE